MKKSNISFQEAIEEAIIALRSRKASFERSASMNIDGWDMDSAKRMQDCIDILSKK